MSSLYEAIIGSAQSPSQFWLVVNIPNHKSHDEDHSSHNQKLLMDLSKGELHGVRGISDSKEILTNWWLVGRNAAIYMNVEKVIALNDVEKVQYDNPDFLVQDNMSALYRIYSKEKRSRGDHSGVMLNLMQQVGQQLRKISANAFQHFDYYGYYNAISFAWEEHHAEYHIQTVDDFAQVTYQIMTTAHKGEWENRVMRESLTFEQWKDAVRNALLFVGKLYSDEAEWLVHSPDFKIPPRSLMLVGIDFEARNAYQDWVDAGKPTDLNWQRLLWRLQNYDRLLAGIKQYRLEQFYTLKFVDAEKFETMRSVVNGRRRAKQAA